jgi:hypothetical protein
MTRELRGRLRQIARDSDSERMEHQAEEFSAEVKQEPGAN